MKRLHLLRLLAVLLLADTAFAGDVLPSWNDMPAKKAILAFVERVTKAGSPDFVPVGERIATFDNDGTLWAEQPMYVPLFFALDRVKVLAPRHPEWKTKEPFASLAGCSRKGVAVTHEFQMTEAERIFWISASHGCGKILLYPHGLPKILPSP